MRGHFSPSATRTIKRGHESTLATVNWNHCYLIILSIRNLPLPVPGVPPSRGGSRKFGPWKPVLQGARARPANVQLGASVGHEPWYFVVTRRRAPRHVGTRTPAQPNRFNFPLLCVFEYLFFVFIV